MEEEGEEEGEEVREEGEEVREEGAEDEVKVAATSRGEWRKHNRRFNKHMQGPKRQREERGGGM